MKGQGTTRASSSRNPRGFSNNGGGGGTQTVQEAKTAVMMNIEMARTGRSAESVIGQAIRRANDNSINTTRFNNNETFETNGDRFEIRRGRMQRSEALARTIATLERKGRGSDVRYSRNAMQEVFTTVMSGSLTSTADVNKAIEYIRKRATKW